MKNTIIVSRCLSHWSELNGNWGHFAFKGFLMGEEVTSLILKSPDGIMLEKGEDYLMFVKIVKLSRGKLNGEVLKIKRLSEVMMDD